MSSSITFKIFFDEKVYNVQTYPYEYRSLMALIYDKIYIDEDFGECKGMGRCGTCIIEILNPNIEITVLDRNESITLEKMGMKKQNTHLACQIEVDKYIEGLEIKILHD